MKKLIVVLFLFIAGPALAADPGFYAGINYFNADYKAPGTSGFPTLNPSALVFKLGKELNPNLAIEGRLGTGLSDGSGTWEFGGIPFDVAVDINNFYGVYFKGMLPTGSITPYGLIGFSKVKLTGTVSLLGFSSSFTDSDSSASYGIGVDFQLSKTAALNLEYIQLLKGDEHKISGISAGVTFKF